MGSCRYCGVDVTFENRGKLPHVSFDDCCDTCLHTRLYVDPFREIKRMRNRLFRYADKELGAYSDVLRECAQVLDSVARQLGGVR